MSPMVMFLPMSMGHVPMSAIHLNVPFAPFETFRQPRECSSSDVKSASAASRGVSESKLLQRGQGCPIEDMDISMGSMNSMAME